MQAKEEEEAIAIEELKAKLRELKKRKSEERRERKRAVREAKLRAKLERELGKVAPAIPSTEEEEAVAVSKGWQPKSTLSLEEIETRIDALEVKSYEQLATRYRDKYGEELVVPEDFLALEKHKIVEEEETVTTPKEKEVEIEKVEELPTEEEEQQQPKITAGAVVVKKQRSFWSLRWWAKPTESRGLGVKTGYIIANILIWIIMLIPRLIIGLPYLLVKRLKSKKSGATIAQLG